MNLAGFIGTLGALIDNAIVPFIFSIAFIVFIWGIFQYFIAGGADEEKRKEGRNLALWGIIGLAVMVSVWGLVSLVVNTLHLQTGRPSLPLFNQGAPQQTTTP